MRLSAFSSLLALGLGLGGALFVACASSAEDCEATASCASAGSSNSGGSADGGASNDSGASSGGAQAAAGTENSGGSGGTGEGGGSGGEGGGPGSECDGDVADDPTCWTSEALGVFVSIDSEATAPDGTRENPYKTIADGIANAGGKNVYVCVGLEDYAEKIALTDTEDGLRLYGGFRCDDWSYDTARRAIVHSGTNVGLSISNVQQGVLLENFEISASDAAAGQSSYGARVTDSQNVTLRRVRIAAGAGGAGVAGAAGTAGANGVAAGAGQDGVAATCTNPPQDRAGGAWLPEQVVCESLGGSGGIGHKNAGNGGDGILGTPLENIQTEGNDNHGYGEGTGGALDGADGSPGNAGLVGAAAAERGTFGSQGYQPAAGNAGGLGFPGQGGGGGGASRGSALCVGASGGAGGMGGCGGSGGKGGGGGGASIGIFSWNSDVELAACEVVSAVGGAGGTGGSGGERGPGISGGDGGSAVGIIAAGGDGGRGGNGGDGGSGSGGSGGPSYALAFSGTPPTWVESETTFVSGAGGPAGAGGEINLVAAPDGSVGDSAPEHRIQ